MREAVWGVKWLCAAVLFSVVGLISPDEAGAAIQGTKHDLSYTSPASVKAQNAADSQICVFCHTPHNANPAIPLWNHNLTDTATSYTLYTSSTLQATYPADNRPDGASKLCLSCHDGTVAIGGLTSGTVAMMGVAADGTMPATRSDLGTNLTNDHPVSINVSDPDINATPLSAAVQYKSGKVQCTSCHDPHTPGNDPLMAKFLVMRNDDGTYGSQLCLACHKRTDWAAGGHRNATNTTSDTYTTGTGHVYDGKTVAMWGCEACHTPHTASQPSWILNDNDGNAATQEEGVCLRCHGASGPGDNVSTMAGGVHLPSVNPSTHSKPNYGAVGNETYIESSPALSPSHAECTDCHNPHTAKVQTGIRPVTGGNVVTPTRGQALYGIWAASVSSWGTPAVGFFADGSFGTRQAIQYEYQLCLRCHNSTTMVGTERGNIMKYVNPNNMAHHAVVSPGKDQVVSSSHEYTFTDVTAVGGTSSLKRSTIYCSDCHDPHANNRWLLKGSFDSPTGGTGAAAYVCYNCHKKSVYGGGGGESSYSRFSDHRQTAHFSPTASWPDYDADGQVDVPYIGCLICHGNAMPGKGGIHGANEKNTATGAQRVNGVRFSNGFGMELVFTTGDTGSYTCGGYLNSTTGVGCSQHQNLRKSVTPPY